MSEFRKQKSAKVQPVYEPVYEVFEFSGGEMKRRTVERARRAGSILDSLNAFPDEPTESLSRTRDRRRKRPRNGRLVHVTSTLGLI